MRNAFVGQLVVTIALAGAGPNVGRARGTFEPVTGQEFDRAVPKDFYLEGNAIPAEKRNAALLKTPAGMRVLFALLDTSGYSSQVQEKYLGMLIAEGGLFVGEINVGVGSYGFGLERPSAPNPGAGRFLLYNQAGEKVGECVARKDLQLNTPRPLQAILTKERARLYLGRYWVELRPLPSV